MFYDEYKHWVNVVAVDLGDVVDLGNWSSLVSPLEGSPVPVAATDDQSVMEDYNIDVIPSVVFIDADG